MFGLYPVLALYLFNISEIVFPEIWQAVTTSCMITFAIVAFSLIVFKHWERAAVFASLTISIFFLYGHVFEIIKGLELFGVNIARHRIFIPVWGAVYLTALLFLFKQKDVSTLTKVLNTISSLLILSTLAQIVFYAFQAGFSNRDLKASTDKESSTAVIDNPTDRDVYYILVDAFGREDLLAESYQVDISSFTSNLTKMGFYIPECSQSNYDYTLQSLTSSLNMQYLDRLGVDYFDGKEIFTPLLQHNRVRTRFETLGYSTITFKSLYPSLDISDSTYYYDYFKNDSGIASLASLNFQYLFLRTTALRPLIEFIEFKPDLVIPSFWAEWIPVGNTLASRDYRQYLQNTFALSTLESLPDLPGKKFVYAHLYVTHQPFVFYPDGRFHPLLRQGVDAYRDQVIYATHRLLQIVKSILEKSKTPPVIIIQGDHSYSKLENRVKIMNAYYFPDAGEKNLYSTITPVNSFRVLFNTYFGGSDELLPDISRYSDSSKILHEAPATCINGATP